MGTKTNTGLRASKIAIDLLTPESTPWVFVTLQGIDLDADGNVLAVREKEQYVNRRLDRIATETITFVDPVTGQIHTITGAGLAAAITVMTRAWMADDFDLVYDADLKAMVNPI